MTLGFCLVHQDDVEIGADGRCLVDGSIVVAPSTGCTHQRFVDGAWTPCVPESQGRPCRPVAAGTWRTILGQQGAAIKKRDLDRAARQARNRANDAKRLEKVACPICTTPFSPRSLGLDRRRKTCSARCGRVLAARTMTEKIPCPICKTPFNPYGSEGRKRETCSVTCSRKKAAATRDSAAYREKLSVAHRGLARAS
jgi:uncharacterized CHY-type Zn-finger protein